MAGVLHKKYLPGSPIKFSSLSARKNCNCVAKLKKKQNREVGIDLIIIKAFLELYDLLNHKVTLNKSLVNLKSYFSKEWSYLLYL